MVLSFACSTTSYCAPRVQLFANTTISTRPTHNHIELCMISSPSTTEGSLRAMHTPPKGVESICSVCLRRNRISRSDPPFPKSVPSTCSQSRTGTCQYCICSNLCNVSNNLSSQFVGNLITPDFRSSKRLISRNCVLGRSVANGNNRAMLGIYRMYHNEGGH